MYLHAIVAQSRYQANGSKGEGCGAEFCRRFSGGLTPLLYEPEARLNWIFDSFDKMRDRLRKLDRRFRPWGLIIPMLGDPTLASKTLISEGRLVHNATQLGSLQNSAPHPQSGAVTPGLRLTHIADKSSVAGWAPWYSLELRPSIARCSRTASGGLFERNRCPMSHQPPLPSLNPGSLWPRALTSSPICRRRAIGQQTAWSVGSPGG